MTRKHEKAVVAALQDILERAEHECSLLKARGEPQGNWLNVARKARGTLGYWTQSEIADLRGQS